MTPVLNRSVQIVFFLIICTTFSFTQDIHFTQFQSAPLQLNPALTGNFDGNQRFSASFRNQWNNVPVDYLTFSGAYDKKFLPKLRIPKGFFSAGLVLNYDQAGDSRLNHTGLALSGSYTHRISKKNYLSGGLNIGATQRAFNWDDLQFDRQFKFRFEPTASNGEPFDNSDVLYFDVGAGINFQHVVPDSRTSLGAGAAVFHINQPDVSLFEEREVKLENRFSLQSFGVLMLSERTDLLAQASLQFQGPHQEFILGAFGKLHLNQKPVRKLALHLGAILRVGDAIAPAIGVYYKDWEAGFSYDINLSDFEAASYNNGGPEVYIKYIVRPAPDLYYCPLCPKQI